MQSGDLFWFFKWPLSGKELKHCPSFTGSIYRFLEDTVSDLQSANFIDSDNALVDGPCNPWSVLSHISSLRLLGNGGGNVVCLGRLTSLVRSFKNDSNLSPVQSVHWPTRGEKTLASPALSFSAVAHPLSVQLAHRAITASSPVCISRDKLRHSSIFTQLLKSWYTCQAL